METVCVGQAYDKRASKMNVCLKAAGFQNMLLDISLFCPGYALEHDKQKNIDETVYIHHLPGLRENGWDVSIAKAPTLLPDTKRDDLDSLMVDLTLESMEISKRAGASYLIVCSLTKCKKQREFFLSFASRAKELGMKILIKNQYDNYNGHFIRSDFSDSYRLAAFVDDLNQSCGDEIFGVCMDVGTCNLLGQNMYEFASVVGNRIKAVYLRENDGVHDSALLPFTSVTKGQDRMDWLSLIRGLRLIQFDGPVVFDFRDTLSAHSHILWKKLTEFAFETSKYIEWQLLMENTIKKYDTRVLFGAGNMCRAYMKCYGQEFPPLFTCDNNRKLWGSTFEGLTIKNPEELKTLPADCAIFICNVYYDEIEEQLRKMEIANPIERFNDEFMPSFYFDRIDAETREIK